MDSLVLYGNQTNLWFEKKGNSFTLDVPHFDKWREIQNFLKRRGFKIRANPHYQKRYQSLSKFHKFAQKNEIICLLEIGCWFIKIHFGHRKNLWETMNDFWDDPLDKRYEPQTYLETLCVKLEINKMIGFLARFNFEIDARNKKLTPQEKIIAGLKNNTHIHGVVTCLEDIKKDITQDSYNYRQNSNDKNGKKIICGQIKYFYDYPNQRLSRGVVWHHINNMWWVIAGKSLRNIAAFELFDYEPGLSRRKPMPLSEAKLNNMIDFHISNRDFRNCLRLQLVGEKLGLLAA